MAAYQCLNCEQIARGEEDCCGKPDLFCVNDMPGEIRRLHAEIDRPRAALAAPAQPARPFPPDVLIAADQTLAHTPEPLRACTRGKAPAQPAGKWRDTVDDMLSVCHMVASDDPRESIDRLINWHVSVHMDPLVSSEAQALIDRGRREAAQPTEQVALTFAQFRDANRTRSLRWHPQGIESWSDSDWITAVVGELGELASLIKMRNRERDSLSGNKFSPTNEQIAKEAADVFTYLDLFCERNGIDLGLSAAQKFNEVSERVGFPDRIELGTAPPSPQPVALSDEQIYAMADAYLRANDAYWRRTDALPTPPDKWRTGTAREATRESLRAAFAVLAAQGEHRG